MHFKIRVVVFLTIPKHHDHLLEEGEFLRISILDMLKVGICRANIANVLMIFCPLIARIQRELSCSLSTPIGYGECDGLNID